MDINWQEVITNVGGQGLFLAAAAWIIKTVLNHGLARDADVFKTQLRADADKEIERLKNSLQMVAIEHQVRFSKLHEKRAEVIAELYKRLVGAYWHGRSFVFTSENNRSPSQQNEFVKTQKEIGYSDDVDQVFRRHADQDSEAMPITYSELMAIRSERSDAGLLHRALR